MTKQHPEILNAKSTAVLGSSADKSVSAVTMMTTGTVTTAPPLLNTLEADYLNLPLELWRLVFQFLSHSDILHGALVSPNLTLSQFCQSQIWSLITAEDWVFEGFHQGLTRNASRVRRITCSAKAQLDAIAAPWCRGITHLDIEQMRFLSSTVLERILEHNCESLQTLKVRLDRTTFQMVTEKIAKMRELKELYLQHWEGIYPEALEAILRSCPQIEVLSLGHNSLYPFKLENLNRESSSLKREQQEQTLIVPFRIRAMVLDGAVIFHDELVLNLASQCPDLRVLSMQGCFGIRLSTGFMMSLAQFCPKLERFNLTNQSITDDFFQTLFCTMPHLKEIKVSGSALSDDDVKVMIEHCGSTLDTLDIGLCPSLSSHSVLAILMGCPRLTHLDAHVLSYE
ncbi:hypothetical protein BCR41DRAFT_383041 [Lobosporangium transversale]|uniref:Uncharacterized protein n=1 Tax=Lobosporangium transversale TaxID=64571 RepID=A0A1Y2H0V6_9FUNG|nr:hypothetical protein BCR41DRAFT_383041 [Lobosporangium transversale]ORZ28156.1 hypothetical protein BCR41DRAFT_383041 [Lobosporangium transversale]|eukprot:XP_021885841.1 hypothetical protein BCR41DRAFT_383041 [Lobosporangium transversale]